MSGQRKAELVAIVAFLVYGTISTLAYKLMESQKVGEAGHERKFFHPYMQSFTMFFGECFCLFFYYGSKKNKKVPLEAGKKPHRFFYFSVPAVAHACESVLQFMALNFISGSTYLMFKGASIVTTAIFSKMLIGMVVERRHWVGCGAAILGLVIVGISGFLGSSSSDSTDFGTELLGYILMLISLIFNGFLYAYQEHLMKKHTINPLQMVGYEGCFGTLFIALLALTFSITPCHFQEKMCVYDEFGNLYLERIDMFFVEVFSNVVLAVLVVVGTATMAAYNLNGTRITKLIDALTRSLVNMSKTAIIWLVGIIITLAVGDNPDYHLQSTDLLTNLVKGTGFLSIVFGTLVYNKIILAKYLTHQAANKIEPNQQEPLLTNEKDDLVTTASSESCC